MPSFAITRAKRDRALIVAGSAVGHLAFLIILGLASPTVRKVFVDDAAPPVVVEFYRPPPPPRESRQKAVNSPAPSPVRPREVAPLAPPAAVAPLPMAPVPKAPAPPATTPPRTGGGSGGAAIWPDRPEGDLREALRRSVVGCANSDAVGLTRRERENCDEKLGAGAKDAPFIPAPMAAAKRGAFDARAAKLARDREWRERAVPMGIDPRANAGGGSPSGLKDGF